MGKTGSRQDFGKARVRSPCLADAFAERQWDPEGVLSKEWLCRSVPSTNRRNLSMSSSTVMFSNPGGGMIGGRDMNPSAASLAGWSTAI